MARPRKDAAEPSVERRMEDAFWELVATTPVDRISVGSLTGKAGCNRGTFYYYYDDLHDMLDRMIERNLPKELPALMLSCLTDDGDRVEGMALALRKSQPEIDKLCLLLASASSALVTRKIKRIIMDLWAEAVWREASALPSGAVLEGAASFEGSARIVLEFSVNGLLGVMAYRAEAGMAVSIEDCLRSLAPQVPEALAGKLREGLVASALRN